MKKIILFFVAILTLAIMIATLSCTTNPLDNNKNQPITNENWNGTFEIIFREEVPVSYRGSYLIESTVRGVFSFKTGTERTSAGDILGSGSGTTTGSFRDYDRDHGDEINGIIDAKYSVRTWLAANNHLTLQFKDLVPENISLTATDQKRLQGLYPYGMSLDCLLGGAGGEVNYSIELKEGPQQPSKYLCEITITLKKKS